MRRLRQRLAGWLRRVATWVDVPPEGDLVARARVLTAEQDARWPDRDGEAKRHQVYARLRKDFPATEKRALSRAIEEALR